MIGWSVKEVQESTAYGVLWLVVRIESGVMDCYRVRKRKGLLYISSEKKLFKRLGEVEVGEVLFVDKGGKVARLQPEGEFAARIAEALETL